jgi:hypothetical protein
MGKVKGPKARATWRDYETLGVQDFGTPEVWNTVSRVSRKAQRPKPHGNILESFGSSGIRDSGGHACKKEKGFSVPKC